MKGILVLSWKVFSLISNAIGLFRTVPNLTENDMYGCNIYSNAVEFFVHTS